MIVVMKVVQSIDQAQIHMHHTKQIKIVCEYD